MRKAIIAALAAAAAALCAAAGALPAATTASGARSVSSGSALSGSSVSSGSVASSAALPRIIVKPSAIRADKSVTTGPATTAYCEKAFSVACYEPDQLRAAYHLPAVYSQGLTGKGTTIVIVDSYGSPTLSHDLAVFDRQFHYPAPPSLKIIAPVGKIPKFDPGNSDMVGWAGETTLDVEYAHTVAPGANILLVETPVSETEGVTGFPQIVRAEEYVLNHHLGDVISQSFSATEQTFTSYAQLAPLRAAYELADRDRVTVLAASGDDGAADVGLNGSTFYDYPVTSWPDSDPLVTGVGGTQLVRGKDGTYSSVVWNDTDNKSVNAATPSPAASGGGKSVFFARPRYQNGVASVTGAQRGVPDISMSAACDGSVDVYSSYPGAPAGWSTECGTSEATPEFAGIVALADQAAGHSLGLINPMLYLLSNVHAPGITDVTRGNNTVSFKQGGKLVTVKGFAARPGYDLASGVGTVDAQYLVTELASAAFLTSTG
jgi:subtilase family serine protease